jgi:hypothetical protein
MKKILIAAILMVPLLSFAQIGIKAGINFSNITNASEINNSSRSGFMGGVFLAPQSKSIIGSRTELLYSRQGYNFKTGTSTGSVNLDYIVIPQFMAINITKFFQIQLGMQMAFLLNAKADSTSNTGVIGPGPYGSMLSYYNKFDYGFGGGIEVHPVGGLVIGGRYNIGLGKLYKDLQTGQAPKFSVSDAKNNMFQIFTGWIFGKQDEKRKKKHDDN